MTFTASGPLIEADTASFNLTPHAVSDANGQHFILLGVANFNDSAPVTALASSNVSWSVLVPGTVVGNYAITVFLGHVTSATLAPVTVTATDTTLGLRIGGQEFASTAGFAAVTLDKFGTLDVTGTGWPPLNPAHTGSLYFGYELNDGSAVNGSTSGFVYQSDSHGNGLAYRLSCPAGTATSPVWGDTDLRDAMAVLVYEASSAPVTSSGGVSLASASARGSGSETITGTGSPSLAAMAAHGAGSESISSTGGAALNLAASGSGSGGGTESITASGSASMATMGATGSSGAPAAVSATGSVSLSSMSAGSATVNGSADGGALGASGALAVSLSGLTASGSAAAGSLRTRGALVVGEGGSTPPPPPPGALQPPAVNNWLSGSSPTADDLTTYSTNAFTYLANPPLFRAVATTAQTGIPASTWTAIIFDSVAEDTQSGWAVFPGDDQVPNAYIAQVPGWYAISLTVGAAVPGGTSCKVGFWYWSASASAWTGPFEFGYAASGAGTTAWPWSCYDETYMRPGDLVVPLFFSPVACQTALPNFPPTFEVNWVSS
jgi:hypothetical protein